MLIIQSGSARRFRKYSITLLLFALSGAFISILTMHWYVGSPGK
jgi:hypothetical protein